MMAFFDAWCLFSYSECCVVGMDWYCIVWYWMGVVLNGTIEVGCQAIALWNGVIWCHGVMVCWCIGVLYCHIMEWCRVMNHGELMDPRRYSVHPLKCASLLLDAVFRVPGIQVTRCHSALLCSTLTDAWSIRHGSSVIVPVLDWHASTLDSPHGEHDVHSSTLDVLSSPLSCVCCVLSFTWSHSIYSRLFHSFCKKRSWQHLPLCLLVLDPWPYPPLSCMSISMSITSIYCLFACINRESLGLWTRDWSIHCVLVCLLVSCHVRWWHGMVSNGRELVHARTFHGIQLWYHIVMVSNDTRHIMFIWFFGPLVLLSYCSIVIE